MRKDLHVICGKCGDNTSFRFEIDPKGCDIEGDLYPAVFISCGNCSTLTSLDEVMECKNHPKTN